MLNRLLPPVLTRRRMLLAYGVAVLADAIQLAGAFGGPPGWVLDEGVDLIAMVVQSLLLGFHPLFLPTFILKAIPGVDAFPTWTGCTLIVVGLRRKQHAPAPPSPPVSQNVIDI